LIKSRIVRWLENVTGMGEMGNAYKVLVGKPERKRRLERPRRRWQNDFGMSYPMGTRVLFLGVKWPGHEADHSPPSSAEVINAWSCTSTLPISLHVMVFS
jgi:hypothetical protein